MDFRTKPGPLSGETMYSLDGVYWFPSEKDAANAHQFFTGETVYDCRDCDHFFTYAEAQTANPRVDENRPACPLCGGEYVETA